MKIEEELIDFPILNEELIKLKFIKNKKKKFVACSPIIPLGRIKVDELFFNFEPKQQIAIIYHELWHYHNNLKFEIIYRIKHPWLLFLFFINKPILWEQEFNADINGTFNTDKDTMIFVLKKLDNFLEEGLIISNHEKTHPPIKERIKRIQNLKQF
jgi:hypothetical protein